MISSNTVTPVMVKKNTKELRNRMKGLGLKLNHGMWMGTYLVFFQTEDTKDICFVASPAYEIASCPGYLQMLDCGEDENLFYETVKNKLNEIMHTKSGTEGGTRKGD